MSEDLLAEIARLTALLAEAEIAATRAKDVRDAAVRAAVAAGVSTQAVAEVAGLSRARVYQIRDGRR